MARTIFDIQGKVEAVLVASEYNSILSKPVRKMQCHVGHGIVGDKHAGVRLADIRESAFLSFGFSKGTEIANHRQFSAVSVEELEDISTHLHLPKPIPHGCLGENLVLSGIPKLSRLPVGTMLFFRKDREEKRTAVLIVWAENMPCIGPGEEIQNYFPKIPRIAELFSKISHGKRGIVGSIYSSGNIRTGDTVLGVLPERKEYVP